MNTKAYFKILLIGIIVFTLAKYATEKYSQNHQVAKNTETIIIKTNSVFLPNDSFINKTNNSSIKSTINMVNRLEVDGNWRSK